MTTKTANPLMNPTQITSIQSLKPKVKKEIKVKPRHKKTITELLSVGYTGDIPTQSESKTRYAESCIQSIINSCHPDIKLLFNHNNVTEYKVTADYLRLRLNTGIKIVIYPNKTINFTQEHRGIKSYHTIHQTRYVVKDKNNKTIIDKKG